MCQHYIQIVPEIQIHQHSTSMTTLKCACYAKKQLPTNIILPSKDEFNHFEWNLTILNGIKPL